MNEFEEIAKRAIEEAEAVDVSFSDFVRGLESICDELKTRLEQAREENQLTEHE